MLLLFLIVMKVITCHLLKSSEIASAHLPRLLTSDDMFICPGSLLQTYKDPLFISLQISDTDSEAGPIPASSKEVDGISCEFLEAFFL